MEILLETEKLGKTYLSGKGNEQQALKDIDLRILKGDFVSVMGPSGSGKSTLLYNCSGMDRSSSGSVRFRGSKISDLSEKGLSALRLSKMGFIFQHVHLLKNLSLFDNIVLSAYLARKERRKDIDGKARSLMERTGIVGLQDNDITQASGGELQRVGICRALINDPEILFGDEPTGALNSRSASQIMEILGDINRSGTTIMLVTHDVRVAAKTDRVLFMLDGSIVGEKRFGSCPGTDEETRKREDELTAWIGGMGF